MKTPSNPNANKRRQAYLEAMARHGFAPHIHQVPGEGWKFEEIGATEGGKLMAAGAFETDTVLCSNDRLAIGMLSAAYELGMQVGHGKGCVMRIAGQDDHPFSRYTCPPLTHHRTGLWRHPRIVQPAPCSVSIESENPADRTRRDVV